MRDGKTRYHQSPKKIEKTPHIVRAARRGRAPAPQ
jgi:hypothetical protein